MNDDYQYYQTRSITSSSETFGLGGKPSSGLGLTVGSSSDAGGGGGGGGRPGPSFFGSGPSGLISGFFPQLPLDSFIFINNTVPSGSGSGIGQI